MVPRSNQSRALALDYVLLQSQMVKFRFFLNLLVSWGGHAERPCSLSKGELIGLALQFTIAQEAPLTDYRKQ